MRPSASQRVIATIVTLSCVAVFCVSALPVEIAFVKTLGDGKTAQRIYFIYSSNISNIVFSQAPGLQDYSPRVNAFSPATGIVKLASYHGDTTVGGCLFNNNCTGTKKPPPPVRYRGFYIAAIAPGALPNLPEAYYVITKYSSTSTFGSLHLFKEVPETGYTYEFPETECADGWIFCDDCGATFDPIRNWIWMIAQPAKDPEPRANQRLIVLDLNWMNVFVPFPLYKVLGSSRTSEYLYSNTTVVPGWLFVSDGTVVQAVDLKTGRPNTPAELFPPCKEPRKLAGVVDWRPVKFNGMICGTLWSVDDCTPERPNSLRAALLCDSGLVIPSGLPVDIDENLFPIAAYEPLE